MKFLQIYYCFFLYAVGVKNRTYANCGCDSCTSEVLDRLATGGTGTFSCGSRINWLLDNGYHSVEEEACKQVANEFPDVCGPECDPLLCDGRNTVDDPDPSTLIWSDEFEGADGSAPDPLKWDYDIGGHGWGNNELQHYTDRRENSFISNGVLNIRAVRENFGTNGYTSARLVTKGLGDWAYGRFRVRARLQQCTGLGTWPAIWMLPTEWVYGVWPNSGEIDIMEHVGYDTGKIHGTVHTAAYNHMIGTQRGGSRVISDVGEWHIYDVIWTDSKIEFIIDGIRYYEFSKGDQASFREWPFDEQFHLLLNVAIGGSWGGAMGVNSTAFEGNGQIMEVDWVRVYSKTTSAPPMPISIPTPTLAPISNSNCGCATCTTEALNRLATDTAGTFSCGSRINWLLDNGYHSVEEEACKQVAHDEFPDVCGPACDPLLCNSPTASPPTTEGIQVMSYNTEYTGYYDGRVAGFGAKISEVGADVVGVQECQDPNALASASGYTLVPGTGTQNYIFYNPSKLQVLESGWFAIPRDKYAPRAITWAKFEMIGSGSSFIFFNAHLPHRHGEASDVNTHASIGETLLHKRRDIGAADMPTVVVCDCNPFASDGAPAGSFEDKLAAAGIPRLYIARGNPGYTGLDKIFASSSDWIGSGGTDAGTGGSDHPAITINLVGK